MSETPAPVRTSVSKTNSTVRNTIIAALIGAAIGVRLVRHGKPSSLSPGAFTSPMAIALYLWTILSVYWEIAARKTAAAKSGESPWSRAIHLIMIGPAQLLLFWPFPGWPSPTSSWFAFPRMLPQWPFLAPLGLALTAGSMLFAIWSRRQLGRNWSGAVTVKVDHQLVRTGPYRRIRHPIYTGVIGMYVGTALVSGRLQGLVSIVLVAIAYTRKVRQEERALGKEFGSAYDEYRRESWAVIPGLI